jgi:protein-disulfide isomerase
MKNGESVPAMRSVAAIAALWIGPALALHAQRPELDGVGFDRGDPNAPLLVVEFADFGCSACTRFALETFPKVDERLITTGQVRWKFIPFELGAFRHSKEAAMAALCAAEQDGFWQLHDVLFADGGAWKHSPEPQQIFREFVVGVGLDAAAFDQCYERDETEDRAKEFKKLARKFGVRGTPTFFVGEQKVAGAPPADEFLALLTEQQR